MRNNVDKVERAPVESKVSIGTLVGGAGAVMTSFVLWILGVTIFGVAITADQADDAIAAVPWPITGVVGLVLTLGGFFVGGYMAKHTYRPGELTQPVVVNNVSSFPVLDESEQDEVDDLLGEEVDLSDEADDLSAVVVDHEDEPLPEDGIPDDPEKA